MARESKPAGDEGACGVFRFPCKLTGSDVKRLYYFGWSAEEMLRQHSDLRPEQVYAALGYFYDNYQAMLVTLKAINERGEARLQNLTISRQQLLQWCLVAKG